MSKWIISVFLLCAVTVQAAPDPELGGTLSELFLATDTDPIWELMSDEMKAGLKSADNLKGFSQQVGSQAGTPGQIISEEWTEQQGFDVFQRVQRFETAPMPLVIQWAFDGDGLITGFFVRPMPAEPSQAFEDYETNTSLRLPFDGEWYVFWGGNIREQNYHVDHPNQRYAYDLVVMRDGKSFEGDEPSSLDSFYCFGKEILAPAAGEVVVAIDGLPDQQLGSTDTRNPPGNHVVIDHGHEEYSLLAHLQQGSVAVKEGDTIEPGQLLGLCGNSGNTSEPHLHYHLQNARGFGQGHGLPAPFSAFYSNGEHVDTGVPVKGDTVSHCDDC